MANMALIVALALIGSPAIAEDGFQWNAALRESGQFLAIQHIFRLATEPGTRAALKGPFWSDYGRSIKGLHGWSDGDPDIVNYVGHPTQGAVVGFIAIQNDPQARKERFGRSRSYWNGRLRATAYSAIYSEQFEIGPISEASIGNIQMGTVETGFVDHVVTPTLGLGWMVAEDMLDEYVVLRLEHWTRNPAARAAARTFLNPTRSFSNVLRFKPPWHRDTRGGVLE